jgi:membrane protease YdiL (CAAX protease family)
MPWDFWLIFLVLSVFIPWRGRARLQRILARRQFGTRQRLSLYASTILAQWLAVGVTASRLRAHGFTAVQLGLTVPEPGWIAWGASVGALLLATLQWLNLRRMGTLPLDKRGTLQPLTERILPRCSLELAAYLALAVTAGLCEEFLYRGFAMAALTQAGLAVWGVVLVSSLMFALAHLYQGRGGLLSTLVLGTVFALARITYHSLLPVMLWHIAVDVAAGIAGPRYLLGSVAAATER